MPRALIIEDNANARADLCDRLNAHPEVTIVGEAASFDTAQTLLSQPGYDLVFLDIELIGGNAFDLVPAIPLPARIIFVTGFDDYAVRAFEVNALDYLMKPVKPERLASALAKLPSASEAAAPFASSLRPDDMVYLRNSTKSEIVPLAEITAILAAQNYTDVWLANGHHLLVRRTLSAWEGKLGATTFSRIARDAIVNLRQVIRHERAGEKGARLYVQGRAQPVTASQRHWPAVRRRLSQDWTS